jgi:hypothetical protein
METSCPGLHTLDGKRKASDASDNPIFKKRIKNSHTVSPEKDKKALNIVPFPEKVCFRISRQ